MKTEKEIIDDLKPFLEILPIKISRKIKKEKELIEVVLDLGRPPKIRYTNEQDIILNLIITQYLAMFEMIYFFLLHIYFHL